MGGSGSARGRRRSGWSKRRIALAMMGATIAVWLLVKASEDWRTFAVVTLNGITLAALFFVVASGFTLIFGLMRVVNMAHRYPPLPAGRLSRAGDAGRLLQGGRRASASL